MPKPRNIKRMTDFPFSGLNLAITTPFDAEGRIDFARLEQNIERYLDAGVQGFVLSSGTGMHVYLSKEESNSGSWKFCVDDPGLSVLPG
jgi:dihydrodipicolinate synthase/N-acetylneuraminate lyase